MKKQIITFSNLIECVYGYENKEIKKTNLYGLLKIIFILTICTFVSMSCSSDSSTGNTVCTDSDSDGYYAESGCGTEVDCNDNDGAIYPGATELCDDGVDNDCDNVVDCVDALSIRPTTAILIVNDQQDFDGVNGIPPYTYSITADTSGGASVNSDGLFTAGPNPGSSTMQVRDMSDKTFNANITVNDSLSISPATVTLLVNEQQDFDGVGGIPPYTYNITADTSGGATVALRGLFTAGSTPGNSIVQVLDSNNNYADALIIVNAPSPPISQSNWDLWYTDSQETDVLDDCPATNAFDGNINSIWHTQWLDADPPHPHEIQIDLGAIYEIDGFRYMPRQGGQNGIIGLYAFFVRTDTPTIPPVAEEWGNAMVSGEFAHDNTEKEVTFPITTGRYVRLVAYNEINGNPWTSVAELNVLGTPFSGNFAPNGVISIPTEDLIINAGDAVNFGGTGVDSDGPFPLRYTWNFGDTNIPNSDTEDPGTVVFNNSGTYAVSFSVTDALGRSDLTPATRIVKVLAVGSDQLISQSNWDLHYTDSEELSFGNIADYAFDSNPDTMWHTEFVDNDPLPPHEIQINLGSAYAIDRFFYLPRQDGYVTGRIGDFQFYISANGKEWNNPWTAGSFENDANEKSVLMAPKMGQFVRLIALNEINGNPHTSMAEINIEGECSMPYVKIINPLNNDIQSRPNLSVTASVCLKSPIHNNWGVKFMVDGGIKESFQVVTLPPDGIIYSDTFKVTFDGILPSDDHTIECFVVNDQQEELPGDTTYDVVTHIGLGDYYVALGDSITAGYKDDDTSDDLSVDQRNSGSGYEPFLNDLLTSEMGYPHFIANEGRGGETSDEGLNRLPLVLSRHPNASYFLIQYGTNDGGQLIPMPSGKGLTPGNPGYPGTFKDNLQQIIDLIKAEMKSPYLAKVPFTLYSSLNQRLQDYNIVIDELISANQIPVIAPDFYAHFENNQNQLADSLHPNGQGYHCMAVLWFNAIVNDQSIISCQ